MSGGSLKLRKEPAMLFQIQLIDPNHGGHRSCLFTVEAVSEEALVATLGLKKEKIGTNVVYYFQSKRGNYFADICQVAIPLSVDELKKKLEEEAASLWAWGAGD